MEYSKISTPKRSFAVRFAVDRCDHYNVNIMAETPSKRSPNESERVRTSPNESESSLKSEWNRGSGQPADKWSDSNWFTLSGVAGQRTLFFGRATKK